MLDGKAVNALVQNRSTLRCPICLEGFKDFQFKTCNDYVPDDQMIERSKFNISPFHLKIKIFEFLVSIGKKKFLSKQSASNEKIEISDYIKLYQNIFRRELGIRIDFVKPGFGTTNSGNY